MSARNPPLLSLAVAETAAPARYTAALDLGRAERSHHFGIVTLFNYARFHCTKRMARVARRHENAPACARAIESRKARRRIKRRTRGRVIIRTSLPAITTAIRKNLAAPSSAT